MAVYKGNSGRYACYITLCDDAYGSIFSENLAHAREIATLSFGKIR